MLLTLNNLAKEYKLLPSEALARASTFDLYILDLGSRYLKYRQDIADGKIVETTLTQDEMLDMIKRARSE